MKRVVLLAILAMALPMGAWADSNLEISNANGTLAVSAGGITLTDSTLFKVGSVVGANLGTNKNFVLAGTINGTWTNTVHIGGATSQLLSKGSTMELSSGDTSLSVPEPGTLGLLGTGLVGIAGLLRRRFKRFHVRA